MAVGGGKTESNGRQTLGQDSGGLGTIQLQPKIPARRRCLAHAKIQALHYDKMYQTHINGLSVP